MNIVAGSYERFILGWSLDEESKKKKRKNNNNEEQEQDENMDYILNPIFTYPAHMGPIKTLAMAGSVLVTGGMDDTIKIFDMAHYLEVGSLLQHSAAVTSLCFYGDECYGNNCSSSSYPRNLLSGSLDGTICIWDSDLWVHLKTMKAHKKGVNDLAIHPSGRLALSVGRDCHLSMFNLIKGRCSFTSNLQKEATVIEFNSKVGDSYSVAIEDVVSVHNAEDARLVHSLQHGKRVNCLSPSVNGLLLTGGEESTIRAWDLASGKTAFSIENALKSRIKGLAVLGAKTSNESDETPYLVASASSDGSVRIWDTRMACTENPTPVFEVDSKARITCLAASAKNVMKRHKVSLDDKDTKNESKKSSPQGSSHPVLTKKKKFKKRLGIEGKESKKKKKKHIEEASAN